MNNNEKSYLETIFKAIPLMDDFEKGRLLGIAEEMERTKKSGKGFRCLHQSYCMVRIVSAYN